MDEYIKKSEAVDVIVKYHYDIAGKTATAIKMIEDLPSADVVPKGEVEKLNAEIETLKDNNEHLAVILEEAKSEVGKLQNELVIWKQNRFNLFQRLECYEMARQKVASEIFANLEKLHLHITNDFDLRRYNELKKKYTEGEDKPAASEEKYFSPGDVAKMTHQEVREKYTAICKSMERW